MLAERLHPEPIPSLTETPSRVRRGSTVRVRQRALQKRRKAGLRLSSALARSTACGGYGALYGASRSRSVSVRGQKTATLQSGRTFRRDTSSRTAGLSRRRSRVRVPSLPLKTSANRAFGCLFWPKRSPASKPVTCSSRTRISEAVRSHKRCKSPRSVAGQGIRVFGHPARIPQADGPGRFWRALSDGLGRQLRLLSLAAQLPEG
jgi:hypothetical protein